MLTVLYGGIAAIFVAIFTMWGWSVLKRIGNLDQVLPYLVLFVCLVVGAIALVSAAFIGQ